MMGRANCWRGCAVCVGPRVPIVASLDLHANVTAQMLDKADALTAYRTYPHVDMAETGDRAAFLLSRIVERSNALVPRPAPHSLPDPDQRHVLAGGPGQVGL